MKFPFSAVLFGAALLTGPSGFAAPLDTSIPVVALPNPNGFDLLVEAGKNYAAGNEGEPMASQKLSPGENVNAQRGSVGRNQKTLEMLRQGLQLPVVNPPVRDGNDGPDYVALRVLARLLKQEAGVRSADQNWAGAMNSQLDAIEMGVDITCGGDVDAAEAGLSIESLGRLGFEYVAPHLTAQECLEGAARLAKIEKLRPMFADIIREQKSVALSFTRYSLETRDWEHVITGVPDAPPPDPNAPAPDANATDPNFDPQNGDTAPEPPPVEDAPAVEAPKSPFSPQEIAQLRDMGLSDLQSNLARYYDTVLANAALPYGSIKRVSPAPDPWSRWLTTEVANPLIRLSYEAARTHNLLLSQALILSAAKLTTGTYPATLDLPADPFKPSQPLIYKPNTNGYLLYSVGPDGKDDGGTAATLQLYKRDDEPGAVSSGLSLDSKGDILAPIF